MSYSQYDEVLHLWEAFIRQELSEPPGITPPITHSWRRCQARELAPEILPQFARTQPTSELRAALSVIRPMVEDLCQLAEGAHCVVVVGDVRGIVVDVVGQPAAQEDVRAIGIVRGACWCEECRGTNAAALALIEAFPALVVGAEHYLRPLHPYFGAAAPIYDGLGLPIGTVAIVGRREWSHPHSLGMVSAAAQAITNQLQTNLWLGNAHERLSELNAILQTLSEGVLLLTREGIISHINARAGQILRLAPERAMGRRLREVLEVPGVLAHALNHGQELHDDEIAFAVQGNRVACLCTLKIIHTAHDPLPGAAIGPADLVITPSPVGSFVLSLRPVERMQRIVQRMAGARARMRFDQIIGTSSALIEAKRLAQIAAQSQATVLLRGETGTGKELFAQSIHNSSARADGPFVAINCAAIPRELITSELFGYEGGAFTGADRHGRPGKFELAHGGTLFLDEIGDMPRDLQTTLLRALETRTITRIGGQQVIPVDVRIIAATHKPLEDEVASGAFRSDLFYRLNVFALHVPPLRDRKEDIPALVTMMMRRHSETLGHPITMAAEALSALMTFDWPGNVRELENTIERCVYIAPESVIGLDQLPRALRALSHFDLPPPADTAQQRSLARSLRGERAAHESEMIERAIEQCNGNKDAAARLLGISRTTLWRRRKAVAAGE